MSAGPPPDRDPRKTPLAFTPEEAAQIREMFKTPGVKRFTCPSCGGELHSGTPMVGGSMSLVWDLTCDSCHRTLLFSERR